MISQRTESAMEIDKLERIHEGGLSILAKTGMALDSGELLERCRHHGLTVDGSRVFMTERQVARALELAPRTFELEARNPSRSVVFGAGPPVIGNASGPTFVLDGGELRSADLDDVITCAKLCHQLADVDYVSYALYPGEMDRPDWYRASIFHYLHLTDKPFEQPCTTELQLRTMLDTNEIVFGSRWHERPRVLLHLTSTPPLRLDASSCRALSDLTDRRQPVCLTSCALGGISGPATTSGLLALQHAEALAICTVVQMLQPHTPFMYGGLSSAASMRHGGMLAGAPAFWAVSGATVELGHLVGLPVRAGGGTTDAHEPDIQAGIESALGLAFVMERGVDFIYSAVGLLDSYNAIGWEKLVIDDELVGSLKQRPWDPDVSADALALDVTHEAASRGGYLAQKHTRRHTHDRHRSPVFIRERPRSGEETAGESALSRAAERVNVLLQTYREPEMDPVVARQLRRYCLE